MAITTIGEFVAELSSLVNNNESIKKLTFPIDFKDPTVEEMVLINTYNDHLVNQRYADALEYRKNNPILESFICDANKLNLYQTLMLTVHSAEGTRYDDSNTKIAESIVNCPPIDNIQIALEAIVSMIRGITIENESKIENLELSLPKHKYVTSLPANPDSNTYYYLPEE